MKKLVKILAATAVLAVSLTGCKKATDGKFVLGLDASFPPMGFTAANGEIIGYDIDLAKEVAKRLNKEFVAKPINWEAKEMELSSGSIDCIWNGFTITPEREEAMSLTKPYLNNDQVLVVRKEGDIKSLKDAKGKVIGVQASSSAEDAIKANQEFNSSVKKVVLYEENLTALTDLEVGGVDAVVMDSVVANYTILTSGKPLEIIGESLAKEAYGIGFRKDEKGQALRDQVQATLEQMASDGTVEKISLKWFGSDISVIGK
jgi:polar amino acid transport system substrate-binding protein